MIDAYIWIGVWVVIIIMLIISLTKIESEIAEDRINKMCEYLKERKGEKMVRYIDANALLKAMDTWDKFGFSHSGAFVREPENDDYVPYVHYADMVKCVEGMPTADVVEKERYARLRENANILAEALNEYQTADFVEVVRCKDCKQYERHIKAHYKNGAEVESLECRKYKMAVTPDWFCADGERREDGAIQ